MQTKLMGGVMSPRANLLVRELQRRRGESFGAPKIDFAGLGRLPRGTFGRELVEFCRVNAITPATISDEAREDLERVGAAARYICIHDAFHVVLDCDTSIPGELRITAFILEQGYFKLSRLWLALLYVLGPLIRPWRARQTLANIRLGRALARRCPMLLAEPIEDWFADDIARVRERLGVAAAPG